MKMRMKKFVVPMIVSTLSLTALASDLEVQMGDFTLGAEGQINLNHLDSQDLSDSIQNFQDSHVTLTAAWKDKVRAVIRTKVQDLFVDNEIELKDDFDLDTFLEEAFIEIRDVGGAPVAVVIGKQPIAFGQNLEQMPIYTESPLRNIQEVREVMGVTVKLEQGLLGLVDSAEMSVFETEQNDLKIGEIDGVSFRVKKSLAENIQMSLSHARLGDEDGDERRTSVGLIATLANGDLVGWSEATLISDNPQYPEAEYAITVGARAAVTDTIDVIVEYNHLLDYLREAGVGAMVKLTQNISAGAEIRYKEDLQANTDEVVYGLTVQYAFGNPSRQNESYIFGDK